MRWPFTRAGAAPRQHPAPRCGACRHFSNAPAALEAAFPGLTAMSSGHASVRAEDGLCARRDLYLSARATCAGFEPRGTVVRGTNSPADRPSASG